MNKRFAYAKTYIVLIFLSILFFFFYREFVTNKYLGFSDGAKFAEIARNIYEGRGYVSKFSFFSTNLFAELTNSFFSARGIPITMPYSLAAAFALLGISDFSVVLVSGLFYLGLVVVVFFLSRHLWGDLVGFLSAVAIATNLNFLDYATSGASETLFTFLTVLATYFLIFKKKWSDPAFIASLLLLYFTKPQGFAFIAVLFFVWLTQKFSLKKTIYISAGALLSVYVLDKYILYPLSWRTNVYPIFTRAIQAFYQYTSGSPVSDALRGGTAVNNSLLDLVKKVFYNLYNFYKQLPQISSPYMWALFFFSLIVKGKTEKIKVFKLITVLLIIVNYLMVALTIPFYRYLHPVVPYVYIAATATLIEFVKRHVKRKYLPLTSFVLISIFVIGQTLGVIFLDSRFHAKRRNKDKQPIYVQLSYLLKENTKENDLIITNLDTWGTWYGERKTVWYPLKPEMLDFEEFKKTPFNAIYLTNYLMDDENYYMGEEWRQIFYEPENPENIFIANNYELKEIIEISAEETYENQDARAVLLVRKEE